MEMAKLSLAGFEEAHTMAVEQCKALIADITEHGHTDVEAIYRQSLDDLVKEWNDDPDGQFNLLGLMMQTMCAMMVSAAMGNIEEGRNA